MSNTSTYVLGAIGLIVLWGAAGHIDRMKEEANPATDAAAALDGQPGASPVLRLACFAEGPPRASSLTSNRSRQPKLASFSVQPASEGAHDAVVLRCLVAND